MRIVLGISVGLLALLALFLVLPIRVRARWDGELRSWAGLGPVMLSVYPPKPGKKTEKTSAAKKPSATKKASRKKTLFRLAKLTPELMLEYAKIGKQAAGRMFRALKISNLQLHAVVAASDPGCAAMAYGGVAAMASQLASMLDRNINWRKADVFIEVNFDGKTSLRADITIRSTPAVLLFTGLRAYRHFSRVNAEALKSEAENEQKLPETAG